MKRKCTIAIFSIKLFNYTLFIFSVLFLGNQTYAQSCAERSNLVTNNDTSICLGKSVGLSANGGGNIYSWTALPADASLTTPNIANPVVTPTGTTVYTVTASGVNLLTNGNFENGNTGFTSQYTYVTGSTFNSTSYSINTNPSNQNSFFSTCGDHTSGNGKMMVVDGGIDGIAKLWCQTVAVVPNTDYTFSYWIQDVSNAVTGDTHPAGLDAQINGTSIGIGASPVLGVPCGGWIQKIFTWNSGNATTADVCINDTTTFPNGNDFALDDILFGTNCTFTKSVTVTAAVCHLPLAIQASHLDADCSNGNGSITVTAVNGTGVAPYTYSLNGGVYTSNNIFSGLSGGIYAVSVKDANIPASTHDTSITVAGAPAVTVNKDTTICTGTSLTLSVSGGSNYVWTASPADTSLKTPNSANPVVKPSVTTTYTVTSGTPASANLISNPGFEDGNTGFTSTYTYVTGSTFNSQSYSINANPSNQNSFFTTCGDHTSGTGKMMVLDGGIDGISKLWCETVPVSANTTYTFSYWIQDVSKDADGDGHPAGLDAQINGASIGIGISPVFGLPCGGWAQKTFTWNSGNATTADICINDTTTFPNGNDFAIDDISFTTGGCTVSKSVTVTTAVCHTPLVIQGSHVDADCTNGNGSITVSAITGSGVAPYLYSLNGGAFSNNNTFSTLSGGSYKVSVKDAATPTAGQVDTTIVIAPGPVVTVHKDTSICANTSLTLSVSGGNNYVWTAAPADASLTIPNSANPVVTPLATTVYTVTSGTPPSNNLITNPGFENGNTGFTSTYTYVTGSTFNSQSYSINANPSNQNSFFTTCGDHTSGSGKMMVVDGGLDGVSKLWCESIPVSPNTIYTFSYWIQDVSKDADGDGHPAGIDAQVNGSSIGLGISPVFGLPCGAWVQKTFNWNSGSATTADICLNDTTTFPNGNDFAIDDISFVTAGCTVSKNVTVTVNPATVAPKADPVSYCQNAMADPLTATGSGLLWYTALTGGTGIASAPTPSTTAIGDITYYVSQTGATCGESSRIPVVVTINANPTVNAGTDTAIFIGTSVILTGNTNAANGNYLWLPSGATTLATQVSPQITTTYTLHVSDNGCSASDSVVVTVLPDECITLMRLFTPNNDGYNDVWKVYSGDCYKQVQVSVYNRWGGLVYHSDNYANDWNGTYNGKPVPDATYYYVIMITSLNGGYPRELTGNVTILR